MYMLYMKIKTTKDEFSLSIAIAKMMAMVCNLGNMQHLFYFCFVKNTLGLVPRCFYLNNHILYHPLRRQHAFPINN
jgi:hypothetical protein